MDGPYLPARGQALYGVVGDGAFSGKTNVVRPIDRNPAWLTVSLRMWGARLPEAPTLYERRSGYCVAS